MSKAVQRAHAEVFNVLLSILDDGRVTDSKGRTVNFANTVVILTSNLGSEALLSAAHKAAAPPAAKGGAAADPYKEAKESVMAAVRRFFRPEFLNRLDDVVVFEPLRPAQLLGVARLLGSELAGRLAPRNIGLRFTDAALAHAVRQSYDPTYGARPLRRWLEQAVITTLSRMIVSGELPDSSDVVVDVTAAEAAKAVGAEGASSGGGFFYIVTPKPAGEGGLGQGAARGYGGVGGGYGGVGGGQGVGGGASAAAAAMLKGLEAPGSEDMEDEEDDVGMRD
ncbi:Chaperone protein ClpB1 [Tetrabaena socialis]|uniref:Chaperone protein ClpB1 n=1 Tax=Tetrabaena socialis TaxID=47790 RepID=A0A2J8AAA8_9CHLO|nr:Chaperone protein ClpB1 [Tetrabaena socialis]|eukprot:PNH09466.1 Chaperone protein ClpB1 [Tetrabaena socialis]